MFPNPAKKKKGRMGKIVENGQECRGGEKDSHCCKATTWARSDEAGGRCPLLLEQSHIASDGRFERKISDCNEKKHAGCSSFRKNGKGCRTRRRRFVGRS